MWRGQETLAAPRLLGLAVPVLAYQPALRFNERPVDAVHLVVEATGITQVVSCPVPPPEWGGHGPAVDTLSAFREVIKHIYWVGKQKRKDTEDYFCCSCYAHKSSTWVQRAQKSALALGGAQDTLAALSSSLRPRTGAAAQRTVWEVRTFTPTSLDTAGLSPE